MKNTTTRMDLENHRLIWNPGETDLEMSRKQGF